MPVPPDAFACHDIADRLEAFVDGELELDAATAVQTHLDDCAACREQQQLAVAVRDGLRTMPELDTPEHVLAAVRRALAAESAQRPTASPRWAWRTAVAAALVVAAASGVLWWHGAHRPQPVPSAQVVEATAEARRALGYLAGISRRAGIDATRAALVTNLLEPALRSVGRSVAGTAGTPTVPGAVGQRNVPPESPNHSTGGLS